MRRRQRLFSRHVPYFLGLALVGRYSRRPILQWVRHRGAAVLYRRERRN